MIDTANHYLYASNNTRNRVEVFNLYTYELEPPIPVGSKPRGLDITPDGASLYVADTGGGEISVVDIAKRKEARRVTVPPRDSNNPDSPFSIAIANNGRAFFSTTTPNGGGYTSRMMQLDLATDTLTHRTDFGELITEATFLEPAGNRAKIAIVMGDTSDGPVFWYWSQVNSFSQRTPMNESVEFLGVDAMGSTLMVGNYSHTYVLDGSLATKGTFSSQGRGGVAPSPSGTTGYRVLNSKLEFLDLVSFQVTRNLALGDTATTDYFYPNAISRLAISPDGKTVVATTDHGFSVVRT